MRRRTTTRQTVIGTKLTGITAERIATTIASLTEAFSQTPPDFAGAKELAVQLRYWRGLDDATKDWEPGKPQVMIH